MKTKMFRRESAFTGKFQIGSILTAQEMFSWASRNRRLAMLADFGNVPSELRSLVEIGEIVGEEVDLRKTSQKLCQR